MIPGNFEYQAPDSLEEVIKIIAENDEAKLIAGGHSLLPMMKLRFAEPTQLVDLKNIEELKGIELDGDTIRIGAMTTETELLESDIIQKKCPLLIDVAKLIADPQVRNKGTIGGDIAHGDPGNDHPAVMLVLDAQFVINGPDGERTEEADGFFLGTYWNKLEQGEILTQIIVPVKKKGTGYGFNKLKRKTGDFATAASPVVVNMKGKKIEDIRIALTNVGACSFRATEAEDLLRGQEPTEDLLDQACEAIKAACEPSEDLRGDVEYKSQMAAVMARRAIESAVERAKG